MNWKLAYAHHEVCRNLDLRTAEEIQASGLPILEASVPGCLESELMRAGKLEDIYFSTNTLKAQELEDCHLWYFTMLDGVDSQDYLRFDGIDTFADIYVNGELVLTACNMFLPYEAHPHWRRDGNQVVVHIKPAMLEARSFTPPVSCNAQKYNYPSLFVRKASHMFGWDIMPRIVSAGLWKEVHLCREKADCIQEVYFATSHVDLGAETATVVFYINARLDGVRASEYSVRVEGNCQGSRFVAEERLWHNTQSFPIFIRNCRFWQPRNVGEPNLYETTVTLFRAGKVCDVYRQKMGVRTIELERTDSTDAEGNGEFVFRINGKRIFVLGTNWVPLDALHAHDPQRLPRALELLDDIGCNMVRCWGGNVYESDAFYDYCDEHGIMVWQDFAMACAVYPNERKFAEALEEEAISQIKRLRRHVSLTLWSGDNECDLAYMGWDNYFEQDPSRNFLTRHVLKHAVETHDYARPYLPSSPYVSEKAYRKEGILPEMHLWGPRDYFKGDYYKNQFCHFASETGYHGFPSIVSLKQFLKEPEKLWTEDKTPTEEYLVHAASMELDSNAPYAYRIRLAFDQVVTLFGKAETELGDFVKQSQISQAEAKKYFIEKFRVGKWKRTGIIWWNLLDGWPQISDAVVDYYFRKKLAYHYIKRSQQPLCLMFDEPSGGRIKLMGVNDLPQPEAVSFQVQRISSADKETVLSGERMLPADATVVLDEMPATEEKQFYLITWENGGKIFRNHYVSNIRRIDYRWYLSCLKVCGMDQFE